MKYRSEIDGLRTIAVLSVIAFHLGVPLISGGFVGVDIFFVISGYLITSLIAPEIEEGRFSILNFYERRIRRILPALFAVIAATVPFAVYLLLPPDLKQYSQSIAATTLFSSNLLFWHEAGYFSLAAHAKPLLHTWSLAVEEQFYIFFPLILLGVWRAAKKHTRLVLLVLLVLSLALSAWEVTKDTNSAFYLPQFRAWELLIGCVLALIKLPAFGKWTAEILSAVGIGLIFYSVVAFTEATRFPGLNALIPAVGAAMIIMAGDRSVFLVGPMLRTRPFTYLGRLSYSLYLWHWPLLVFVTYFLVRDLNGWEMCAVGFATLILSAMSYKWIEQPARKHRFPRSKVFAGAAAAMAIFIAVGLVGQVKQGFPNRLPENLRFRGADAYNLLTCLITTSIADAWREKKCTFPSGTDANAPRVFLWGDSFAAHYFPGLIALQKDMPFTLIQATFARGEGGSCVPLPDPTRVLPDTPRSCEEFHQGILELIEREKPALVIFSARWDEEDGKQDVIRRLLGPVLANLKQRKILVLVVGESPTYPFSVVQKAWMDQRRGVPMEWHKPKDNFASDAILKSLTGQTGAMFFSPSKYLCNGALCRYSDGNLLHWDEGHLTEEGSKTLVRAMSAQIGSALKRQEKSAEGAGNVGMP